MTFRAAALDDCARLAELNHQLIRDEGHRNRMTVPELEERMRAWISGEYRAVIFEEGGEVGFKDYSLALEILPGDPTGAPPRRKERSTGSLA